MISCLEPADLEVPGCASCGIDVTVKTRAQFQQSDNPSDAVRFVATYTEGTIAQCFCRKCLAEYVSLDNAGAAAFREKCAQKLAVRYLPEAGAC